MVDWLIPFHLIEQYAHYLNSSRRTSTDETLICNCTEKRIGIDCQYEIRNKNEELTVLVGVSTWKGFRSRRNIDIADRWNLLQWKCSSCGMETDL